MKKQTANKFSLVSAMARMLGFSLNKPEEPKFREGLQVGGRAFGFPRSVVLSRSNRKRNKFSPGNSKHFTKKQLRTLAEANK